MGPVLPARAHAGLRAVAVLVCTLLAVEQSLVLKIAKNDGRETRPSSFNNPIYQISLYIRLRLPVCRRA
jgi:hypothetical protein